MNKLYTYDTAIVKSTNAYLVCEDASTHSGHTAALISIFVTKFLPWNTILHKPLVILEHSIKTQWAASIIAVYFTNQ